MTKPTCKIDDCDRPSRTRGLCGKHYEAWRQANPEAPDARRRPPKACDLAGCERNAVARGWCNRHYQSWLRLGDPAATDERIPKAACADDECSIEGCERPRRARGWCLAHLHRFYRHGSPTAPLRGERANGVGRCPDCGVEQEIRRVYCQPCEAARQLHYIALSPRYTPVERRPAECEMCGSEFMADDRRSVTCSPACSAAHKRREDYRHRCARRARLLDAFVESFTAVEIYERDGWICQLCGDPIDPSFKSPHALSPNVDHVIPLARGGEHSRANAQASHRVCNLRKGVRIIPSMPQEAFT